jgi:signal transduction histidine kinase
LREEIEFRKKAEILLEKKVDERTAELKRSNQRLEQSNKELEQFAFIASHDLQEPLRKIQTFSNIALQRYLHEKPKVISYLQRISSSANRLRDLITDLLNYSRINAEEVFRKSNLNVILEETLADLEYKSFIQVDPIPEIEVVPSQMRQVFQNLINNSMKFSRQNIPCKILVKADLIAHKELDAPVTEVGDFCRISISDNGIGFNNQYNSRIFEIFKRLNHAELYEGSGIGLAIVKKIIEKHDGIIYASGRENEGATFIIILPLRHSPSL